MKVAIIGLGVVGSAQARWLDEHVHVTYDPKNDGDDYPAGKIAECDFAVVCVPTPMQPSGWANLDYVYDAIGSLPDGIPAILRSTVPPGTTEALNAEYGNPVAFVPEFMQENLEKAVWKDPQDVPYLIIGSDDRALGTMLAANLSEVYEGTIRLVPSRVAELSKYVMNTFLATKVTYANEMARICAVFGVKWEDVERLWRMDPRTGFTHTSVIEPGGYGGACFPKDISAIIAAAEYGEYDPSFLKAVRTANGRFRAEA